MRASAHRAHGSRYHFGIPRRKEHLPATALAPRQPPITWKPFWPVLPGTLVRAAISHFRYSFKNLPSDVAFTLTTEPSAMYYPSCMDMNIEAARLLDTDEPIGSNDWPLACYVSEAIENEMDTFTPLEKAKSADDRLRLALRRVINNAASYAEGYELETAIFRAACETRRL